MGEKKSGCGLLDAVLGRRAFWTRKAPPPANTNSNSKCSQDVELPTGQDRVIPRPGPNHINKQQQQLPMYHQYQKNHHNLGVGGGNEMMLASSGPPRKVPKEAIGISGELENIIADYQTMKGSGGLVRASSSNVMLFGNMGNLRQQQPPNPNPGGTNNFSNNIPYKATPAISKPKLSMCRAISARMDPETLKIMGNEDFKNGRFEEALALYDAAISVDPDKASYRSNKSAALTALGRIPEAVFECIEAIKIEPYYQRAHQRLGRLYLRLGEAEKALYHYKHAGPEVDPDDIGKTKNLQATLIKCMEARKQRDWNTLVKETNHILSACADSAPQIYAFQAEALLRLRRHQEADDAVKKAPKLETEECAKLVGPYGTANWLLVQALVHLSAGRFSDAVSAAHGAARLDTNNREAKALDRRARAVAAARSNGNELFKVSKFAEACNAYDEGLNHDPSNSVLLCNRAACRSKVGEVQEAVEDCNVALALRPNYSKARLRRADCFAKMQRWEASIEDYKVLVRERPDDEEVRQRLVEAQTHLQKQCGT